MNANSLPELVELPQGLQPPDNIQFFSADGVEVKALIMLAGMMIPMHVHEYDHLSMLAFGRVRMWVDGECKGLFSAPCGINIEARHEHAFMALENGTTIYCIHNVSRTGEIETVSKSSFTQGEESCLGE